MKRSDFLEHVGWTGAGIAYTLTAGGILSAAPVGAAPAGAYFVQISDSHIGFHQAANPDVSATLDRAVKAINALAVQPEFVVHTGDVTHLSTPDQMHAARDILHQLRAPLITLPGEHDVIGGTKTFFKVFASMAETTPWFSFDANGMHYVGLVNVFNFETMGLLGQDQLSWLKQDLAAQRKETPIVVFAHVPLYALYPQWGWSTQDGSQALALLQRFDRVTVLSGHIHQVVRHVEGNITFASANATAYPQPQPGKAPKPGPLVLPPDALLHAIGYRTVELAHDGRSVIADDTFAG